MDRLYFTIRLQAEYIKKLAHIALDNSRSINREIIKLIRDDVQEFENEHGVIAVQKEEE